MHYNVRDMIKEGESGIEWIPSLSMLADGLIKALLTRLFKKH